MKPQTEKLNEKTQRLLTGEVVSTKMKDTIVVSVSRYRRHPKYHKYLSRSKRFKVHDAGNVCKMGDTVFIKEVRPISKDKRFVVVNRKPALSSLEGETL